ncbi:uncharacterized protein PRCAT00003657001 [Priceomyces carsonii]|uniref:uncharacterized protein n=1 Tax=Priceomyces carsonii TaxID=28549 RepID=UPI002ED8E3CE|nr:unnamed protein product [Priceomyces carsonii]
MVNKIDPRSLGSPMESNSARLPSNSSSLRLSARPPLYSVPSSQSLRSLQNLYTFNDPLLDTYVNNKYKTVEEGDSFKDFDFSGGYKEESFDKFAYLAYYMPVLKWLPQYRWKENIVGDFVAGVSLASFQTPLVMSFATSLAHLPPVFGLYSVIIGACVYAIFGTVPILVVGPTPSIALIIGQVMDSSRHKPPLNEYSELDILTCLSAIIGGVLLGSGLFRIGFLDKLLSRALLKGFIGAMGLIMIINELATQFGIYKLSLTEPHLSTLNKLSFIFRHYDSTHRLTFLVSAITLTSVLVIRKMKTILTKRFHVKQAIYIPDLLLMVIITTYLSWNFEWKELGLEVVGDVSSNSTKVKISNPFSLTKAPLYKELVSTALVCTMLGYFDSTTAAKALSTQYKFDVSSNRELIALGAVNFVVGLLGVLPSFGAIGRSKINILSGAKTPMASIFMSILALITLLYLLPFIYYLPDCVLAICTTIVGITVLEDIPSDLKFFWDVRGYDELLTFAIIFLTTMLWSAQAGVTLGFLIAIFRVIKQGTKSRIQVLGRVPNSNSFRNADALIEECFSAYSSQYGTDESLGRDSVLANLVAEIEEIEGVLIISIPEPLNFANSWDLKSSLSKIEKYGTLLVHPSQPVKRAFNKSTIKFIIIDCRGMDYVDTSAIQVLLEIIKKYIEDFGILVCFSRVPVNLQVRDKFIRSGIQDLVNQSFKFYIEKLHNDATASRPVNIGISSNSMGDGFFLSIDEAVRSIRLEVL